MTDETKEFSEAIMCKCGHEDHLHFSISSDCGINGCKCKLSRYQVLSARIAALTLAVGERDTKIEKLREAMRHYTTYGDTHSLQAMLALLAETAPATEAGK